MSKKSAGRTSAPPQPEPITKVYPLNHGLPATVGKFLYHLVKLQYKEATQQIPQKDLAQSCEDSEEEKAGNRLTRAQIGGIARCLQGHKWDTDTKPYIMGRKNSRQNGYSAEAFATDPLTIKFAFELDRFFKPQYESLIPKNEFINRFQKNNNDALQTLGRRKSDIDKSVSFLKKHAYIDIVNEQGSDHMRRLERLRYEKHYLSRAEKLFPAATPIDPAKDLEPYRKVFHHYHLTLNRRGKPTWIYKTVDFTHSDQGPTLSTTAAIKPEPDEGGEEDQYIFRASLDGPHLIMWTHRESGGDSDIGVEIYPRVEAIVDDPDLFPSFYGARINQTWYGTVVASSIAILSVKLLVEATVEGPLDESHASTLERKWEEHGKAQTQPEIVRLPTPHPGGRAHSPHDITGRWQYEVRSAGAFNHSGDCRVSFVDGRLKIAGERIYMRTMPGKKEVMTPHSLWETDWCEICVDGQLRFIYHIEVHEAANVGRHLRGMCEVRINSAAKMTGTYHLLPPFDSEILNAQSGTIDFKRIEDTAEVQPPTGFKLIEGDRS
jgi:hypothetical protein